MILLPGCATKAIELPPAVSIICPRLVEYAPELLNRAADEVEALPENSAVVVLLKDYGSARKQARACREEKNGGPPPFSLPYSLFCLAVLPVF